MLLVLVPLLVVVWIVSGAGAFVAAVAVAGAVWHVTLWLLFPSSSFARARLLPTDTTFDRYRSSGRGLRRLPGSESGYRLSARYQSWVAAERDRPGTAE